MTCTHLQHIYSSFLQQNYPEVPQLQADIQGPFLFLLYHEIFISFKLSLSWDFSEY